MMPKIHDGPADQAADLETCSALFDGELQGDAARFALKRLGHDVQWREACGHWQLLGDVLRGQATSVAPRDFADRVAAAIAVEPALQAVIASTANAPGVAESAPRRRGRQRWIGGAALAASVAVAALFVARPFSQDAGPGSTAGVPATQMAAASTPTPAVDTSAAPARAIPGSRVGLAAAAVAVAEVPRRAAERRARGAALRVAGRAADAPTAVTRDATLAAVALAEPATTAASPHPFRLQQAEIATRPWPRATLPNYPATGALTASFGSSAAGSPSFYPFEPQLPAGEGGNAAVIEVDGPRP